MPEHHDKLAAFEPANPVVIWRGGTVIGRIGGITLSAVTNDEATARRTMALLEQLSTRVGDGLAEKGEAELGRWQEKIRNRLMDETGGDIDIDGRGCDSGDPLDVTLAEIGQAIEYIRSLKHAAMRVLEDMTPGTAEFIDEPQRCERFIRTELSALAQARQLAREAKEAGAKATEILNQRPADAGIEWDKAHQKELHDATFYMDMRDDAEHNLVELLASDPSATAAGKGK